MVCEVAGVINPLGVAYIMHHEVIPSTPLKYVIDRWTRPGTTSIYMKKK